MMPTATQKNGAGFSLVELMVAMTISLIVMAGVGLIFVNTKKTYETQGRMSRLQENGRFAMHYLMRDIRAAGYMGCLADATQFNNTLNSSTGFFYNLAVPIEGIDRDSGATTWSPSGDAGLPASAVANTDMLAIRMVDPSNPVNISSAMPNSSAELNVSGVTGFSDNDIVLLSDCASADLMQITQVQTASSKLQHNAGSGTPGNTSQKLQKSYDTSAKVYKYSTRRYFIRNNGSSVPSLYMDSNGATPVELVEGIEDLQISYGLDTSGDRLPDRYLKAGQAGLQTATEWANVVSIRIGVLARSLNSQDIDKDNNTYDVNGRSVGPLDDRNQRKVFLATVLLRNLTRQ